MNTSTHSTSDDQNSSETTINDDSSSSELNSSSGMLKNIEFNLKYMCEFSTILTKFPLFFQYYLDETDDQCDSIDNSQIIHHDDDDFNVKSIHDKRIHHGMY